MALCHWFYLAIGVVNTVGVNSTSTNAYSETRYLSYLEWGEVGQNAGIGSTLTSAGTLIGTDHGFVREPNVKPDPTYSSRVYTMFWYQPTWSATYLVTGLRRYNGGESDGDKVRGYCAPLRATDATQTSYD
jgi:hypothetical protein